MIPFDFFKSPHRNAGRDKNFVSQNRLIKIAINKRYKIRIYFTSDIIDLLNIVI